MKNKSIKIGIVFLSMACVLLGCKSINVKENSNADTSTKIESDEMPVEEMEGSLNSTEENVKTTEETALEDQEALKNEEEDSREEKKIITIEDIKKMEAGSILSEETLEQIDIDKLFYSQKINDNIFKRIKGISFGENCTTSRESLRYLRILYTDLEGVTHIGELICNRAIRDDLLEIFEELYENQYPIEKMVLVDEYDGDDNASMADNNTSCFNFREVPGSQHLSQHAYGRAIDINPLYNPYINSEGECLPENAWDYVDREEDYPYKIEKNDLCYKLFVEHGFTWGGSWNSVKDYQHFQKKEE